MCVCGGGGGGVMKALNTYMHSLPFYHYDYCLKFPSRNAYKMSVGGFLKRYMNHCNAGAILNL